MTLPKVLVLDIETSPHIVYAWGLFKQNISIDQIKEPSRMICWAAKWSGDKRIHSGAEWIEDGWLERLHGLMGEADAIAHYNGESFDWPILRREFKEAGLDPLPPPIQVDLLKTVRKFRLASSKLDWASLRFLEDRKVSTGGFSLWVKVLAEDAAARRKMLRYNRYDVMLTDRLMSNLGPDVLELPSVPLIGNAGMNTIMCPRSTCGSTHVQRRGLRYTKQSAFPRFQCQACKGWFSSTVREHGTRVRAI